MIGKNFTIEETAELFHVTNSTIYKWVHNNKIPHVKVGRRLLFPENDIDAFINQFRIPAYDENVIHIDNYLANLKRG
ncbi:MAG: helix-turn-helix domain-containing protein [Saprospiraceae bacterium]|nr:helix-turn-helix domain-containing protein [Saprospiraceae bacterium]